MVPVMLPSTTWVEVGSARLVDAVVTVAAASVAIGASVAGAAVGFDASHALTKRDRIARTQKILKPRGAGAPRGFFIRAAFTRARHTMAGQQTHHRIHNRH